MEENNKKTLKAKNLSNALIVLIIGVILSFTASYFIKEKVETTEQLEYQRECLNIKTKIENRLTTREQYLKTLSAYISTSDSVTRNEWKLFIETSGIKKDTLKSIGIGYNVLVSKKQVNQHIKQLQKEGFNNYSIKPVGERENYTPIIFLEPSEQNNLKALGFDTYSESVRQIAMDKARDYGVATLTNKLTLVQDSNAVKQAGTIMFVPVYRKNKPLNSIEERRAAIKGWISSPYHVNSLMKGIFQGSNPIIGNSDINLKIYDGDAITSDLVFFDSHTKNLKNSKNEASNPYLIPLEFNRQKWTLEFSQSNDVLYFFQKIYNIILISGLAVSFLLFLLILLLFNTGSVAKRIVKKFTRNLLMENKEYLKLYGENKKFFTAVEQSANTILITDSKGIIEYTNPKFTEVTGFSAEEALGKTPNMLSSGLQSKEFYAHLWETISAGKIWKGEFQNKTKAGKIFQEQATISAIKDHNGEIINYLSIKENISALRKNEQRLKTLINASPDAIYFKDSEGKWEEVNKAGLDLFGLSNYDYKGKTDKELANVSGFYKDALFGCATSDEITWAQKSNTKIEETIPTLNGKDIILDTIKIPLFNNDNSKKGLVIIARDITKQKLAEIELLEQNQQLLIAKNKAVESDSLKTEFLNNMSHEIRTPLNGILGFSDLLSTQNLDDKKQKTYVNIIQNSGKQLLHIIDDILEISSLGTKQVKVHENQVCLNDLLLEIFSVFEIKAIEQKNPIYLKKGLSDLPSTIFTDETKLNKVLSNLMENALKFTLNGFIELGYQLKENEIEIYVKDTGIGIDPEKHELIFERFSQAEKELSKNVGGLGLGLSIAKENTELLGGTISVASQKGKGATFFVTIPYKPVYTQLEKNNDSELNVLIVEDVEVNYLYLETVLTNIIKIDCNIYHAKNGFEAIEICMNNKKFDLVLMDLKMSEMNGYEATSKLKKLFPELIIVVQSAYSTEAEIEKAKIAGCDDFLIKPIKLEALKKITNKYLNKKLHYIE